LSNLENDLAQVGAGAIGSLDEALDESSFLQYLKEQWLYLPFVTRHFQEKNPESSSMWRSGRLFTK
jgi:hypothetical protein